MGSQSLKSDSADASSTSSAELDAVASRLAKEILDGRKPELCRQVLVSEKRWKQADPGGRLKWARLAQMAGEAELALEILAWVNRDSPGFEAAWEDRLNLLSVLGRNTDLAGVLAAARDTVGAEQHARWSAAYAAQKTGENEGLEEALAPFETLRRRQDLLQHYMALFAGREDCFARQWADRSQGKQGYVPVRRPLEEKDVEEHLSGRKTYGIYLLSYEGTVRVAVLDADLKPIFRGRRLKAEERALLRREGAYIYSRVMDLAKAAGLEPLAEMSGGKGLHFWFFLREAVPPRTVKLVLEEFKNILSGDLSAFGLEVFPKQEKLSGKGFGNLVKLPLGVHRLTRRRSYFVACRDRSVGAQLSFLGRIKPSGVEKLAAFVEGKKQEKVLVHPRLREWSGEFPELAALETRCPPLGQIIAACRQARAITSREERVLLQTVGFLKRAKSLLHHLLALLPEYNPHLVDFKLSRLRGKPLGCRRVHSLTGFSGDQCAFQNQGGYDHPLLHLAAPPKEHLNKAEREQGLSTALDNLKAAITQVQRFLR